MNLYIIRHGLAGQHGDYANDRERPLTDEGQRKTRRVAKRLYEMGIRFDLILTSPLVRARQTAEILKSEGLSKNLEEAEYLAPHGKIQDWLTWLESWRAADKVLAIVGHEPNLSTWAELLISGEAHGNLILKKAGVMGIIVPEAGSAIAKSQLFWLSPAKFLAT